MLFARDMSKKEVTRKYMDFGQEGTLSRSALHIRRL
jgi:hypothetical protein